MLKQYVLTNLGTIRYDLYIFASQASISFDSTPTAKRMRGPGGSGLLIANGLKILTKTAVTFDKVGLGLNLGLIRLALGKSLEGYFGGFHRISADSTIGYMARQLSMECGSCG